MLEKGEPTLKTMPEFKPRNEIKPSDMMMASKIENERILESLYETYLELGFSPEDAAKKAMEDLDRMSMKEELKGRTIAAEGGMMDLGGNEMDLRGGGFVPIGAREKMMDQLDYLRTSLYLQLMRLEQQVEEVLIEGQI